MESRSFIKAVGPLIARIEALDYSGEDRATVQREVSQLFSGLQNPSLPSAYKLRDAALAQGLVVLPKALAEIGRFD